MMGWKTRDLMNAKGMGEMSRSQPLLPIIMVFCVLAFGSGPVVLADALETTEETVVEGNDTFALDLYAKLREQEGNLFFSPYSISTALAMTYAGARGNTEKQMADVLHFDLPQEKLHPAFRKLIERMNAQGKESGYQLSVANALWAQKDYQFLRAFLNTTKSNYGAGLNQVDFVKATEAARKTINDWVEKRTEGKIKELIKPGILDSLTRLVLTNAIYFKGNWANQFKEKDTEDAPFTVARDRKVTVPMMSQKEQFAYAETETLQLLELPYVEDELSMVILLPKEVDGLPDLENSLTPGSLKEWLQHLTRQQVLVQVPRFKLTSEFRLEEVLKSMGMTDAFLLPPADFSGMTGVKDLFISAVIHKAFVDVNEEGTEAAAATAVVMKREVAAEPPVFRADHPFLFLIRDNQSGGILFLGRVVNPLETSR
jgi:serpin B